MFVYRHIKIDVFKRKITLRVGEEKIVFKSVKSDSSLIKKVYMLSLREMMDLNLEARLIGETLILNRSFDPLYGDYIELNDLNEPLELRRNRVDDLEPTVKESKVVNEPMVDIVKTRYDFIGGLDDYPSNCDFDRRIYIGYAYNLIVFMGMMGCRRYGSLFDEEWEIVEYLENPFCKASCVEARRFDGIITIRDGDDNHRGLPACHSLVSELFRDKVSRSIVESVGEWLDDYIFKSAVSETVTSVHESETSASKTSKENMEKSKTIRSSALIIEDYESDNKNTREIPFIEHHTYLQAENLRESHSFIRVDKENRMERTPQQNGVAERKNRTLIEATTTMLADSLLLTTFWAEAINTACNVQNRVLITKPHNKTPYELLISRPPNLDFMRPFGCHVTILNTLDHLGKFERKADEGFLVGYSINSMAFKNYMPVTVRNQTNDDAGIETNVNAGQAGQEKASDHKYILLPFMLSDSPLSLSIQNLEDKDADEVPGKGDEGVNKLNINIISPNDPNMPSLEEIGMFDGAYDDEDVGAEADLKNLETTMNVNHIPTTRIHKDHPKD
ncbi:retrovirus-related pol polyprotein from transposon TNT 1-94 [Tanacetum coccineum]